jgi:hypothetical protein
MRFSLIYLKVSKPQKQFNKMDFLNVHYKIQKYKLIEFKKVSYMFQVSYKIKKTKK